MLLFSPLGLIYHGLDDGSVSMMYLNIFFACSGRHLPDKAIDLVDEACANVRVQLDSQPEEIDNLERKRMQLEVELHALEKEKDKASKARLVEVSIDFTALLSYWSFYLFFFPMVLISLLCSGAERT